MTRLGSPASPRLVPVDAVACRAYRDPGVPTLLGPGPAVINTTSPKSRHSQKDTVRLNWLGTQNSGVPSDLEGRADIPIQTEMPPPVAAGKGKEAMETLTNTTFLRDVQPPAAKRHDGPRHTGRQW